jgi:hypothetical protein
MAQAFQIVSVERSVTNWGHRHVTTVGTAPKPGFQDRWPVASVIGALAGGDLFYTITEMGDPAFARPYRCMCGFETVRTTPSDETSDGLDRMTVDEWDDERSTPAPF